MADGGDITVILKRWTNNPEAALGDLMPIVYGELRKIAAAYVRREAPGFTLQPTALINEAYLRLVRQDVANLEDRSHFYGVAARTMRQILVDAARTRNAGKRSAGLQEFDGNVEIGDGGRAWRFLELHDALERLTALNARAAEVVELKYFGGMGLDEIGTHLEISLSTVKRDHALGVAWLNRAMASRSMGQAAGT